MWFYSMSNVLAGIVAQSFNVYAANIDVQNLHSRVEQYIHINNHL